MKKALVFAILTIFVLTAGLKADTMEITSTTSDSLELHAWLTPSPAEGKAPLVVMLPMMGHTYASFEPFIDSLQAYFDADDAGDDLGPFPHLLRLDLRGHGESVNKGDNKLSYQSMTPDQFAKMPTDVARVVKTVLEDYSEAISDIYIIGASIGANAAMMAATHLDSVQKVALLSPGIDYRGLKPADAFQAFEGDILMIVARGDVESYQSSQTLATTKNEGWVLKAYPGDLHGTTLINADDRAMNYLLEWLFGKIE